MQNSIPDVIIVGAGGCGLMAALVAAKNGLRVLLLEKTDKPGGGTAFSSRGIRAAGSRRQHQLKINDSAALYTEDILRRNNSESDAMITRRLAGTVNAQVMQFFAGGLGMLALLPYAIYAWRMPSDTIGWVLLFVMGAAAWFGHNMFSRALRTLRLKPIVQ